MAVALTLLAVAGTVAVSGPAAADPRPDQDLADQAVAEAAAILERATDRAKAAAVRFAAADAALPGAEARRDRARGALVAAEVRARSAARAADQAKDQMEAANDRFDAAVVAVDRARNEFRAFAAAAYKGSRLTGLNLMLRADGPAQAVERLGYLDHVAEVEQAAVDVLVTARLGARHARYEASVANDQAESAGRTATAVVAAAELAAAESDRAAEEATGLAETRAEALETARAEREESLRRYEEAEAEAAEVGAQLREWEAEQRERAEQREQAEEQAEQREQAEERAEQQEQAEPDPPAVPATDRSEAGFVMPTAGWESSAFGMRFDPYFGVWQLHSGVDIAAPGGTPIYAVANGTVVRAGWNGGYGNFTCLGHRQGLSTCYAHQSEILVWEGQTVRQGDLIGRVGTTGASTGDHLHFEVRNDGTPTDPIPYLPSF